MYQCLGPSLSLMQLNFWQGKQKAQSGSGFPNHDNADAETAPLALSYSRPGSIQRPDLTSQKMFCSRWVPIFMRPGNWLSSFWSCVHSPYPVLLDTCVLGSGASGSFAWHVPPTRAGSRGKWKFLTDPWSCFAMLPSDCPAHPLLPLGTPALDNLWDSSSCFWYKRGWTVGSSMSFVRPAICEEDVMSLYSWIQAFFSYHVENFC